MWSGHREGEQMRLANLAGRAVFLTTDGAIDVENASDGGLGPEIQDLYEAWDDVVTLAATADPTLAKPYDPAHLESPVPRPRQVFAIGLNYRAHAEESGMEIPKVPATFTKFPSSLTGPYDNVVLPNDTVDWEVELVAVVGRLADHVSVANAWSHIAGLTIGQDLSDRTLQFAAAMQFSLGKSYRGFGPIGPMLVTPDEFDDPDDLELGCRIDGEIVQQARTSDLIFNVPQLIAELSAILPLWPGDVIFTGTPSGVGITRQPPRFLEAGNVVESWIEGIGEIRNTMVAP